MLILSKRWLAQTASNTVQRLRLVLQMPHVHVHGELVVMLASSRDEEQVVEVWLTFCTLKLFSFSNLQSSAPANTDISTGRH